MHLNVFPVLSRSDKNQKYCTSGDLLVMFIMYLAPIESYNRTNGGFVVGNITEYSYLGILNAYFGPITSPSTASRDQ